ncbi:hypothetical protein [Methylobacterium sp. ID0610]|uniref:hypothetical protein n=1 Tax=Methylobacterium carpenticola TaxID=3344827 RepID=UPI0036B0FFE5
MGAHPSLRTVKHMTPRGGLQAAEYEDIGYGYLEIIENSVRYIDKETGKCLISFSYASQRDAALQLRFFRQACQDAKSHHSVSKFNRSELRIAGRTTTVKDPIEKDDEEGRKMLPQPANVVSGREIAASNREDQARFCPKLWKILDMSFPDPLVRMTFSSERQARVACETMNAKARRERFEVVWMGT